MLIKFNDLLNFNGEEYANNCFEWNKKFVENENGYNVLNVDEFLMEIKQKYLIISDKYQKNLHLEKFICIYDYLAAKEDMKTKIIFKEFDNEFKILRVLLLKNKFVTIKLNEMIKFRDNIKFKDEKYAMECYEKNKILFKEDENNKNTIKFFRIEAQLSKKIKNLILSEEYLILKNNGKINK
jgi:hypothetical protein